MLRLLTETVATRDVDAVIREQAGVQLPYAQIGIFDCHWNRPMQATARLRNHNLFLSMSPPRGTQIRCDGLAGRYADVRGAGFFPAGTELAARSEGGLERLLLCRFTPEQFEAVFDEPIPWDSATRLAALELRDPVIRSGLARMATETMAPGLASSLLIEALCVSVMVDLGRYLDARGVTQARDTGKLAPWQLQRIEQHARSCLGVVPRLADVAALCRISVRQLVRAFKASTGLTVQAHYAERQMQHAKALIANPELPLKVIAVELGFRHQASFSSAFARICGESPSHYRWRLLAARGLHAPVECDTTGLHG